MAADSLLGESLWHALLTSQVNDLGLVGTELKDFTKFLDRAHVLLHGSLLLVARRSLVLNLLFLVLFGLAGRDTALLINRQSG